MLFVTVESNAGNSMSGLPVNFDNSYPSNSISRDIPTRSQMNDIIDCEMTVKFKITILGVSAEVTCTGTGNAVTAGDACDQALAAVKDCISKATAGL